MQKIIITNTNGISITLGSQAPYYLETIEGASEVPVIIESQKAPGQDGAGYIGNSLDSRTLTLTGMMIVRNKPDEVLIARRKLQEIFNPKLGPVKLTYIHRGIEKEIIGIVETTPSFPNGSGNKGSCYQRYQVQLLCLEPFWMDTYDESTEMSYILGGLHFHLILPTKFSNRGFQRLATNNGDVDTPVVIVFQGPAINPQVTNQTTGQFIRVNSELGDNDELTISTAFGQKYVKINGNDAFGYIDLESTFWQMVPGENLLSYSSNNDSIKTKVSVSWRNRYVGI